MKLFVRERIPFEAVLYGLYLYFLGLSLRGVSLALDPFVKRSHVAVWRWVQRFRMPFRVGRVTAFLVDETYVVVREAEAWISVAIDPIRRSILGIYLSRHRDMLVAEAFLRSLVEKYGRHTVYSDGASRYPEACRALGLEHRIHSAYEKSLIERAIQYLKDRLEGFDDFHPCFKKWCSLGHVENWLNFFSYMHNARRRRIGFNAKSIKWQLLAQLPTDAI